MNSACDASPSNLTIGVVSLLCRSNLALDPREDLSWLVLGLSWLVLDLSWLVLLLAKSSLVPFLRLSSTRLSNSESFERRKPGVENSENGDVILSREKK